VVELDDPVGHHQRVVVGEGDHPGPERDPLGTLGGGGEEELRGGDDLGAA
jgi:hypothetical protein